MTTSIHDALFRGTFSQIEHATGELQAILPPGLTALIDFATLTLCPGSYVDDDLRQKHQRPAKNPKKQPPRRQEIQELGVLAPWRFT